MGRAELGAQLGRASMVRDGFVVPPGVPQRDAVKHVERGIEGIEVHREARLPDPLVGAPFDRHHHGEKVPIPAVGLRVARIELDGPSIRPLRSLPVPFELSHSPKGGVRVSQLAVECHGPQRRCFRLD